MRVVSLTVAAALCVTAPLAASNGGPNGMARAYVRTATLRDEVAALHRSIPSFSRQTGLACSACHSTFPQLTVFGRRFKLNGYTLTGMQTVSTTDSSNALKLDLIPPVSVMVQASFARTKAAQPDVQNNDVQFPQELSLFVGGAITSRIGTFLQLTYDPADGGIAMDNMDIRYANSASVGSKDVIYGFTLNNNPTVEDPYNSVPAWGFPYASSEIVPTPAAGTLVDGALGQAVAGLGAYSFLAGHLYTEATFYRSAFQGGPNPPDASAEGTIKGLAPYWRAAWEQNVGSSTVMLGTYGMVAKLYPTGVAGMTDKFTDVALDGQFEHAFGAGTFTAHATWIHEKQDLAASFASGDAANPSNTLKTFRADASYYTPGRVGGTVAFFNTTGDSDPNLYPADPVTGSATGSPDSRGWIGQVSWMPWLNTRFGLQYIAYNKFNGSGTNYDGAGRNASDNNTLYLISWLMF